MRLSTSLVLFHRLGWAVAAAVIIWAVTGVFRAEGQSVGLPEVTVTAPPVTPSWKKWNPYSSNPVGSRRRNGRKFPATLRG